MGYNTDIIIYSRWSNASLCAKLPGRKRAGAYIADNLYRFTVKGRTLSIQDGKSHLDEVAIPDGLDVKAISNTEIEISGIDKCAVGQFASEIRELRKPEPYKGKGIRYKGERVRQKEGKKASK